MIRKLNYWFVFLVIIWEPLQLILGIDGKGRILFYSTLGILLVNLLHDKNFTKTLRTFPVVIWLIWCIYSATNLLYQGYEGDASFGSFFVLDLLKQFAILSIATKETLRAPEKFLKHVLITFCLFGLFSLNSLGGIDFGGTVRNEGNLGNMGPLNLIFLIFTSSLLFVIKRLKLTYAIGLILFSFLIVLMAATRKAFAAATIMTAFFGFSQFRMKFKSFIMISLLGVAVYSGISYTLNNTLLGERFDQGLEDGEVRNTSNIETLNFLGDRAVFYIKGWEIFEENMFIGIGLNNFLHKTHSNHLIHSEYMAQLAENGLIGFLLFLLFNIWLGTKLILNLRYRNKNNAIILVLIGGFFSILFINFTAWTYAFPQYFLVYGIIIGFLTLFKKNSSYFFEERSNIPFQSISV